MFEKLDTYMLNKEIVSLLHTVYKNQIKMG